MKIELGRTMRLGRQLQSIMALQFPEVKLSRNRYASRRPNSLPIETQKLRNIIPLPLKFVVKIYAKTLVVTAMVNP